MGPMNTEESFHASLSNNYGERLKRPNAQVQRRRSTAGAQGTNTGHENGEAMARVGVRCNAQLGWGA